jgi:hypothetical protein
MFIKLLVFLALNALSVGITVAQAPDPPLFPIFDAQGKEGYIDITGRVAIAPQFDKVTGFSEGRAAVRVGDKWGYIDRTGKMVIAPQFREAAPFSEGLAAVTPYHDYLCGFIDENGNYVIPAKVHRFCQSFSEGLAAVGGDAYDADTEPPSLVGYIDRTGKWVIQPEFYTTGLFHEGFAMVSDGRARGFIDRTGRRSIFSESFEPRDAFAEGLAPAVVGIHRGSDGVVASVDYGILDHTGKQVLSIPGTDVHGFSEGLALVEFRGLNGHYALYGYADKTGKLVIPPRFDSAAPFFEGLAATSEGYIDHQGSVVIKQRGQSFSGGLAWVQIHSRTISEQPEHRNIYAYLNRAGKFVWVSPHADEYVSAAWMRDNFRPPPSSPSPRP